MDGLTLLSEATAAGLTIRVDGDRLVIRGPKTADAVARRLLEHKPEVVAALGWFGLASIELPKAEELPFPGWVLRPDVTGRLGWEPPDLPDDRRWWARSTFDDLPMFPRPAGSPGAGPCPWCGRSEWWRSVHGVVVCNWCSPPAVPGLVAEWIGATEAAVVGKPAP